MSGQAGAAGGFGPGGHNPAVAKEANSSSSREGGGCLGGVFCSSADWELKEVLKRGGGFPDHPLQLPEVGLGFGPVIPQLSEAA